MNAPLPPDDGRRGLGHPSRVVSLLRLLYPGVGLKRWLALGSLGVFCIGLGVAYGLRALFRGPMPWVFVLPPWVLAVVLVILGGALVLLGMWGLFAVMAPALISRRNGSLANAIYQRRLLGRGPRIVAVGGGTGLSTLLRGLKHYSYNLTAVVTVADDGGSSGRLRREMGVLPPGDIRNCLVALSDAEPLMAKLFQHRFSQGAGLEGHSFGNLFLVAMSNVTGDFETAVHEASRVLAVRGQILPSTLANVTLRAQMDGDVVVQGESNIPQQGGRIQWLSLNPLDVVAYPEAVKAILEAHLIVIGPGSLYTSVLPNLLVPGIRQAIATSPAPKVYVCNVATQAGETEGYAVADHVQAIFRHVGPEVVDWVVANPNASPAPDAGPATTPVAHDDRPLPGVRLVLADVVDPDFRHHHHPLRLAETLMRLYYTASRGRYPAAASFGAPLA